MGKLSIILKREILARIRKRTFIIMSFLGPILFAAMILIPSWVSSLETKEIKRIAVIDSSHVFYNTIPETQYLKFDYIDNRSLEELQKNFDETDYYAVLYITHIVYHSSEAIQLYSDQQPNMSVVMHISNALEKEIERQKLATHDIDNLDQILQSVKTNVDIQTVKWTDSGDEKKLHPIVAMGVSYVSGFLIYIFIFMFGAQVMRSVIEEKTNRIVELIVSSVRPFQLMAGKILGVGFTGLLQFLTWIILTAFIVNGIHNALIPDAKTLQEKSSPESIMGTSSSPNNSADNNKKSSSSTFLQDRPIRDATLNKFRDILSSARMINFGVMFISFMIYFLGGFLLYASLFAAVGSLIDNDTDTQQFMLPVTIPLIIALVVMLNACQNPNSAISLWFSMIPFTSPIVMMARIPYGVPFWEVFTSIAILIITFIASTWISGKIYQTGILMYGKKIKPKDIIKWLK